MDDDSDDGTEYPPVYTPTSSRASETWITHEELQARREYRPQLSDELHVSYGPGKAGDDSRPRYSDLPEVCMHNPGHTQTFRDGFREADAKYEKPATEELEEESQSLVSRIRHHHHVFRNSNPSFLVIFLLWGFLTYFVLWRHASLELAECKLRYSELESQFHKERLCARIGVCWPGKELLI
ncbi:hypothetical protein IQ07DRAFT_642463 [Pyrenochaeta sp. DS3sAY3a]|nr:hypothetical protein IQ07DRAFT_642463 [Pyrenochaeta sp. DS3sAY3a]